ncbi:MAG: hypothetical protein Q8O60_08305, partial [Deltaproteobacteria bacterium]|nr:hypothetical protein [Deltaproteobacteria bacterium]
MLRSETCLRTALHRQVGQLCVPDILLNPVGQVFSYVIKVSFILQAVRLQGVAEKRDFHQDRGHLC